jgi:hypothetical protein
MKYRLSVKAVALGAASLVTVMFLFLKPAASQNEKTPTTADGHPDFSGYWLMGGVGPLGPGVFQRSSDGSILFEIGLDQGKTALCTDDSCQATDQPSYTPAFLPKVKAIAKTEFAGTTPLDPVTQCKPRGVPRSSIADVLIVQTPKVIVMVHGDYSDRVIYMDSAHPADLEPSYMGDSRGHWEGNTLVVDVTGLNDDTWLGGALDGKHNYTSIHSDKEHVVERWTREGNSITYEATVYDPVALAKPWVIAPRKIELGGPDDYLIPYFCDGAETVQVNREHFVKPNPEDRDIRNKCNGHRCGALEPGN